MWKCFGFYERDIPLLNFVQSCQWFKNFAQNLEKTKLTSYFLSAWKFSYRYFIIRRCLISLPERKIYLKNFQSGEIKISIKELRKISRNWNKNKMYWQSNE